MNIIAKVIESKGKVFLEGVSGALKDIKDVREIMEGESIIINGDGSVLLYVHHLGREVLIKESMLITPENIDIYLIMNEGTAEGQEELASELKLKTKFDERTGDEINITVDEKNKAKTSSAKVSEDFTDEVVKNKIVDFKGGPEFSENGETPSTGSNAGGNSGNQSIPRENVFEENINEPVTPTPIIPATPTIIPPVTPSPSEKEDNSGSGSEGGNSGSGNNGGNSGSGSYTYEIETRRETVNEGQSPIVIVKTNEPTSFDRTIEVEQELNGVKSIILVTIPAGSLQGQKDINIRKNDIFKQNDDFYKFKIKKASGNTSIQELILKDETEFKVIDSQDVTGIETISEQNLIILNLVKVPGYQKIVASQDTEILLIFKDDESKIFSVCIEAGQNSTTFNITKELLNSLEINNESGTIGFFIEAKEGHNFEVIAPIGNNTIDVDYIFSPSEIEGSTGTFEGSTGTFEGSGSWYGALLANDEFNFAFKDIDYSNLDKLIDDKGQEIDFINLYPDNPLWNNEIRLNNSENATDSYRNSDKLLNLSLEDVFNLTKENNILEIYLDSEDFENRVGVLKEQVSDHGIKTIGDYGEGDTRDLDEVTFNQNENWKVTEVEDNDGSFSHYEFSARDKEGNEALVKIYLSGYTGGE